MAIKLKRIYEPAAKSDGYRILVDRLWPRGLKKEEVHIDKWLKEIAPSAELRKWFDHDAAKWAGFIKKYHTEIKDSEVLEELKAEISKHKIITLLYAAKEEEHNNAVALMHILK